ncbi:pyridoxamine 5'-phosphate oxidase family protein [Fusobacterium sp. PH5-44]|uniref:pyridoxamine 5'-phosphate oxidase family protein n=1 Tax=unclassified Fusobacterium TaxID=2648384 RepID=UPI003D19799B
MFNEKFMEVIKDEGVVAIVTTGESEAHVSNTWNSYLTLADDNLLMIPAAGMIKTEKNILNNSKVKLTIGSKNVMGYRGMGTGFLIEGTASFLKSGEKYEMMKAKFPFLTRVLVVEVNSIKQTL